MLPSPREVWLRGVVVVVVIVAPPAATAALGSSSFFLFVALRKPFIMRGLGRAPSAAA